MKWSLMLREDTLQINLEPENDHEREAVKILRSHGGSAEIRTGVSIAEYQGGYMRNFGERSDTVAITIRKDKGGEDGR